MTWAPLLLTDPSPALRLRVLRELLGRYDDDAEVRELAGLREADPLVAQLLRLQEQGGARDGRSHPALGDTSVHAGSWKSGLLDDTTAVTPILATTLALLRLSYLGYWRDDLPVQRGAEYLFAQQRADGAWPLPKGRAAALENQMDATESSAGKEGVEGYSMMPLQTALPLRALAASGYATDPRAERAYEWLMEQRLPDGAWPTGMASGTLGYVAGYRKLAHSRWGCRANTTGALACLALHPTRRSSPEANRALDLLLGRETHEAAALGCEVARLVGAEPAHGFLTFYARFDLAFLLDLCGRVGVSLEDERVAGLAGFIHGLQGPYGLWEYADSPQVSRWLTFDLLCSFTRLGQSAAGAEVWLSQEPRTPFQPYPRQRRRY